MESLNGYKPYKKLTKNKATWIIFVCQKRMGQKIMDFATRVIFRFVFLHLFSFEMHLIFFSFIYNGI